MSRLATSAISAAAVVAALIAVPASTAAATLTGPDGQPAPAAVAAAPAAPTTVTVAPGDTLSGFAALLGVDWQALAAYNQLDHPDLLAIGQVLTVPPVGYVTPPAAVVPTSVRTSEPVVTAGQTLVRPPASRSIATYRTAPAAPASGFEACVIARESGGNAQVMNGSGHYGLFQYSYSTWVANGGSPSSFGHASVAEQQVVFDRTSHSAWTPYDGCR